ncbi:MAG: hypothetical protein U1F67_19935 [Rubrivivax sp.]
MARNYGGFATAERLALADGDAATLAAAARGLHSATSIRGAGRIVLRVRRVRASAAAGTATVPAPGRS